MRDYLLDIVSHTQALGCIELIKIVGDTASTTIFGVGEDKSVVISAKFKQPSKEFTGTFGMPNLVKLNTILNIPEYKEKSKMQLLTQDDGTGNQTPSGLHFENEAGDFMNDYRFMPVNVINAKLETKTFKGANWNVEFTPAQASLQRFKFQAGANSEETQFIAKTDGTNLKFYFGDHSTHAGDFVFHSGVTGKLTGQGNGRIWYWPILRVLGILGLQGDKVMRFSDDGAIEITVDSGLIDYSYIILAQTK